MCFLLTWICVERIEFSGNLGLSSGTLRRAVVDRYSATPSAALWQALHSPRLRAWLGNIASGRHVQSRGDVGLHTDLQPLLSWIGSTFVPLMRANEQAYQGYQAQGQRRWNEAAFDRGEALYDALTIALRDAAEDPAVAVVLITGNGRAFSAGTDLLEMGERVANPDFVPGKYGFIGLVDALAAFDKPLVLAINGLGLGIGLTIIGFADLAFMSTEARLKCPFTSLGVAPEAAQRHVQPVRGGDEHVGVPRHRHRLPVGVERLREVAAHVVGTVPFEERQVAGVEQGIEPHQREEQEERRDVEVRREPHVPARAGGGR